MATKVRRRKPPSTQEEEVKRRKPASARKEEVIPVRLTKEQKATLVAAAERKGVGVSTWLLMLGLAEAAKEQTAESKEPPKK